MGLLGWWQLENDRDNSGNGKHITTLSGVTLTDGKIGKCYEFTSGSRMIASGITVGHSCTITAWGYSTSWASSTMLFSLNSASFSGPDLYFTGGVICWNTGDGASNPFKNNGANVTQPSLNTWHHYAVVVDAEKNKVYLYLNGEYYGEANYKSPYQSNRNFVIGNYSASTSYAWRGRIDDVRLYDYCLSPKEIKELSKALVLHYKFDDFQEPTKNLYTDRSQITTSGVQVEWVNEHRLRFSSAGGTSGIYFNSQLTGIRPNTDYVLSYRVRKLSGTFLNIRGHVNSTFSIRKTLINGEEVEPHNVPNLVEDSMASYHVEVHLTSKENATNFYYNWIQPNFRETTVVEVEVYDIQIEEKSYATPFVIGEREGVVNDSSGYDNHAELALATTPKWVGRDQSKIGGGAYSFNGSQAFQLKDTLPSPPDQVTVSAWVKTDDASVYQHVFSKSTNVISCAIYQSRMYCKFTIGGVNRNPRGSTVLQSNRWYHLVWLYDGKNIKFYIDGELDFTSPNYTGALEASDDPTLIGAEMSGATGSEPMNRMLGLIDDIRVYATALSDEDILELYQTRGSIDSHGNLYVQDIIETGHKPLIADYTLWQNGQTGSISPFSQNGSTSENYRILGCDPWGKETVLWEARPAGDAAADGGWNMNHGGIDPTKLYRYSVWAKRSVQGNGSFYLGTMANQVATLAGVTSSNPYFYSGGAIDSEWQLYVGHVHPHNYTGGMHPDSGRYKVGGRIGSISADFKWLPTATTGRHRSYLYYSSDTNTRQQWCYPRVDICDGTEPSIQELLDGFDSRYVDYVRAKGGANPITLDVGDQSSMFGTIREVGLPVRYIRDWINGSTSNTGNHWVEIEAYSGGVNVALGKSATSPILTDGAVASSPYYSQGSGLQSVQVDLGEVCIVEVINVRHYYADGRTYHNTKTEVSADGVNWVTVFDSAIEGEYPETSAGNTIICRPQSFALGASGDVFINELKEV